VRGKSPFFSSPLPPQAADMTYQGTQNTEALLNYSASQRFLQRWNRGFLLGYAIETVPGLILTIIKIIMAFLGKNKSFLKNHKVIASLLLNSLYSNSAVPFAVFLATFSSTFPLLQQFFAQFFLKPKPQLTQLTQLTQGENRVPQNSGDRSENEQEREEIPQNEIEDKAQTSEENQTQKLQKSKSYSNEVHPMATFLAGTLASSMIFFDSEPHGRERRVIFALYTFVRTGEVCFEAALEKGWIKSWYYGDTFLFVMSCWEIMYSWFYTPEALPPSYQKWISNMAGMDLRLLDYLRLLRNRNDHTSHTDVLHQYALDYGYHPHQGDPGHGFVSCTLIHPHAPDHCYKNWIHFFRIGFVKSLKIYIPVQFIPLLFRFDKVKADPVRVLLKTFLGALQSSTFLATFIMYIWAGVCIVRNALQEESVYGPMFGTFLCGFSLLLEKKSRRSEFALYVIPRALISLYIKGFRNGYLPNISHFSTALFSLSSGTFLTFFVHNPRLIKPVFRSVLSKLLG